MWLKVVIFTFLLCVVVMKLPFKLIAAKLLARTKKSFGLMLDKTIGDDEMVELLRTNSFKILVETMKIFMWLIVLILLAILIWFGLNYQNGLNLDSFDVFITLEGVLFSLVGMIVYVLFRKVIGLVGL